MRFLNLIDRVSRGDEVVITRHGRPVARLLAISRPRSPRRLGTLRGQIRIGSDFDAPLSEDFLDTVEDRSETRPLSG
jgi:prevent-host-death family protein